MIETQAYFFNKRDQQKIESFLSYSIAVVLIKVKCPFFAVMKGNVLLAPACIHQCASV